MNCAGMFLFFLRFLIIMMGTKISISGGTCPMKKLNTRQIALNGIVAGLYAAITILTA